MTLRLGFYYHVPAYLDESGSLRVAGHIGRFLDGLAAECKSLICFLHSPPPVDSEPLDYVIQQHNVRWVDLGPKISVPQRMLKSRQILRPLVRERDNLDALLIRGPSPLLPAVADAARDVPIVLLLVGDYVAGSADSPIPRWRKEIIRLWSRWYTYQQMRVARRALTLVNSHALYERFEPVLPNLFETRTTTLRADDFFERDDTCNSLPVHLLYTGRLDHAKGILRMVEVVNTLTNLGEDVVLDLIGYPEKRDPILNHMQQLAARYNISERIVYHGYKSVGPELFAYYQNADIYVIASEGTEGFPRTVWEALAHSLPVVATRVGSLPHYLQDGETAILIEPRNTQALFDAVSGLMRDSQLRRKLIQQGRMLARQNTLEKRSKEVVDVITQFIT